MSGGMGWIIFLTANIKKKIAQVANKIGSAGVDKIPVKCPNSSKGTRGVKILVSKRWKQKPSLKKIPVKAAKVKPIPKMVRG